MGLAFICSSLHKVEFSVMGNACIHLTFPEAPLVWSFRIVPLTVCVLSPSAPGGHLERDRSLAGKCPQQPGSQHWTERGSPRSRHFNHFLPAQQTDADDPPDQCGAVHQLTAQLLASSLWSVSLLSYPHGLPSFPDWWKGFACSENISGKQSHKLYSDPNNERVNSAL